MKFSSYNFVLNEAPNNNDAMHVGNMVLNEVPNSNDTTYSEKCTLNYHEHKTILNGSCIYVVIMQKSQFAGDKR